MEEWEGRRKDGVGGGGEGVGLTTRLLRLTSGGIGTFSCFRSAVQSQSLNLKTRMKG